MRSLALLIAPFLASCASMSELEEPRVPPASIAVVFDRESATPVIVEGLADRTTGRHVGANDPVRIASISKLVMALAAMRLVDEGKVDLNRDVSEYLGWPVRHPSYPEAPVTLAQLMSHRSGLRDDAGYVIPLGTSLEDKLRDPAAWYADAPPGEAPFEYANLGSPVVATVLEAASDERFDRLVERTVFAPLGVEACFNWIGCSRQFSDKAVTLYRSTGEVARDDAADRPPNCSFPVADGVECTLEGYVPGTNASIFSPQGGVRIGMMDLAKLGQVVFPDEEEFLSFSTRRAWKQSIDAQLRDPSANGQDFFCIYGFSIQLIEFPSSPCEDRLFGDDVPRIGHAGEAYGLRSGLWFAPDEGSGEHPGRGTGIAYFTTQVPDRTAPDEGGFAPEEIALVRRAMAASKAQGGE